MDECEENTTPEGLFCEEHWSLLPGILKQHYQSARILAIQTVKAKEEEEQ